MTQTTKIIDISGSCISLKEEFGELPSRLDEIIYLGETTLKKKLSRLGITIYLRKDDLSNLGISTCQDNLSHNDNCSCTKLGSRLGEMIYLNHLGFVKCHVCHLS